MDHDVFRLTALHNFPASLTIRIINLCFKGYNKVSLKFLYNKNQTTDLRELNYNYARKVKPRMLI